MDYSVLILMIILEVNFLNTWVVVPGAILITGRENTYKCPGMLCLKWLRDPALRRKTDTRGTGYKKWVQ